MAPPGTPEPSSGAAPKQIPIVCPGHTRPLAELQYIHVSTDVEDRTLLLSACHDKMPMLRDGESGDWIGTFSGHKGAVWSCQMDGTGNLAATASGDYSARVWDAITGQSLAELPHNHIVKTCTFSPNSRRLVTGGKEALMRVYDLVPILLAKQKGGSGGGGRSNDPSPPPPPQPTLQIPQEAAVTKCVWMSDSLLLCGCMNGKIYLWSTDDPSSPVHTFDTKTNAECRDVEVRTLDHGDSGAPARVVLTVAAGNKVFFFDATSYELLREYVMPIHFRDEGGATLHPSGTKFVAGGSDLWVRVFDFETGAELECHKGHHGPIRCVRYSPNGQVYASGSEDGTIRLWRTDLQQQQQQQEEAGSSGEKQ
jgi:serine-threonine kinase receptor-associated protein